MKLRNYAITATFSLKGGEGSITRIVKASSLERAMKTKVAGEIRRALRRRGLTSDMCKSVKVVLMFFILLISAACTPVRTISVSPPDDYVYDRSKAIRKSWRGDAYNPNPCWSCYNEIYIFRRDHGLDRRRYGKY